jgi:Zn-dependent peptidase ImmA (M78 family)
MRAPLAGRLLSLGHSITNNRQDYGTQPIRIRSGAAPLVLPVTIGTEPYCRTMPKVRVSAVRVSSLLANRNMNADALAERVTTVVRPHDLLAADQDVEFEDLVKLAKVFGRPWSYLLIDAAEVYPNAGSDNRTYANQRVSLSPELLAELQMADLMLAAAADLFPGEGYQVPTAPPEGWPVERLGTEIRAFLGVSVDDQLQAKDEYAALRLWVAALNARGVYVSQRSLKDPTVRAFSKVLYDQAVIVVSTKDDSHPRIFSAIHEYCHVTLHSTGICDLLDYSDVERYCNEVAAGVLLPMAVLNRLWTPGAFAGGDDAADAALKAMSNRAHVSQQALLIALRQRHLISQDVYDALEARRAARRKTLGGKSSSGGPTYYAVAINKIGRMFAHRVVDAMTEGAVDRQDASVLLGVGEHNVGNFVHELVAGN